MASSAANMASAAAASTVANQRNQQHRHHRMANNHAYANGGGVSVSASMAAASKAGEIGVSWRKRRKHRSGSGRKSITKKAGEKEKGRKWHEKLNQWQHSVAAHGKHKRMACSNSAKETGNEKEKKMAKAKSGVKSSERSSMAKIIKVINRENEQQKKIAAKQRNHENLASAAAWRIKRMKSVAASASAGDVQQRMAKINKAAA